MIVSSDGYSIVYYPNRGTIVIDIPTIAAEQFKLKASDEAAILTMVKVIVKETMEARNEADS